MDTVPEWEGLADEQEMGMDARCNGVLDRERWRAVDGPWRCRSWLRRNAV